MSAHAWLEGLVDWWLQRRELRNKRWERRMLRSMRISGHERPPKGIVLNIREPNK